MRLFKYVIPERIDILETQRIAFSPPENFNDVMDSRLKVVPMTSRTVLKRKAKEADAKVLKEMPAEFHALPRSERRKVERDLLKGSVAHLKKIAKPFAEKLQSDIYAEVNQRFCVLCLTTNPDHELMWGHYADGHRGFVIELDASNRRFSHPGILHKMIYSETPPTYDPAIGSDEWWKIKSIVWEYEDEYRVVSGIADCEKKICGGRAVYFRHLPHECIKAIYLGFHVIFAEDVLERVCFHFVG